MRTHPPSLLTLTRRAIVDECALPVGAHVLVAVSGGPDSMTLLHALYMLCERGHLGTVSAHGVDHGLRPAAPQELDVAEAFAVKLGIRFARTQVSVAPGGNLQARARKARYAALDAARRESGAHVIATGHHADDRAETVLIRLLRGAPPAGLAVLPPRTGDRIRPFIRARRSEVRAHAARHEVPSCDDPSNTATQFLRVRVRHEVLPLLESLSPGIVSHLNALADALSDEAEKMPLPAGVDPRVESRRTIVELARIVGAPKKFARARVLLKGGVVLSAANAQAPWKQAERKKRP